MMTREFGVLLVIVVLSPVWILAFLMLWVGRAFGEGARCLSGFANAATAWAAGEEA